MVRCSVWIVLSLLLACKPESTAAPADVPHHSRASASPGGEVAAEDEPVDTGRFSITFHNACERPVQVYFAPLGDDFVPGQPPEPAESITVAAHGEATHSMDPNEGAWLVDEQVGTTARTAFGHGAQGWRGEIAIARDCRSFAD